MSKTIRLELFHKILFLKANLNFRLPTAKAVEEKPCVQVKHLEIAVEQHKSDFRQQDLKLSGNSSLRVRTQKDIQTFLAEICTARKKSYFMQSRKLDLKTGIFFCATHRPTQKLTQLKRTAPKRILGVNKA